MQRLSLPLSEIDGLKGEADALTDHYRLSAASRRVHHASDGDCTEDEYSEALTGKALLDAYTDPEPGAQTGCEAARGAAGLGAGSAGAQAAAETGDLYAAISPRCKRLLTLVDSMTENMGKGCDPAYLSLLQRKNRTRAALLMDDYAYDTCSPSERLLIDQIACEVIVEGFVRTFYLAWPALSTPMPPSPARRAGKRAWARQSCACSAPSRRSSAPAPKCALRLRCRTTFTPHSNSCSRLPSTATARFPRQTQVCISQG